MRRSDHPSRPSARICCCLVSSKTLLMPVTEPAFRPDVNVSIATANGRFSAVDQWPVLGVHRGLMAKWIADVLVAQLRKEAAAEGVDALTLLARERKDE